MSALRQNPLTSMATGGILTFGAMTGLLSNPLVLGGLMIGGTAKLGKTIITSKALKQSLIKALNTIRTTAKPDEVKAIQSLINKLPSGSTALPLPKKTSPAVGQTAPSKLKSALQGLKEQKGSIQAFNNDKNLMFLHNLTEANYNKAKDIGGLANPSVAISDISKNKFDSYGDITLIGDKYMPFSGKGKTIGGDIYSPRFPNTQIILKDIRPIQKRLENFEDVTGEKFWNIDTSDIQKSLENSNLSMADFLNKKEIKTSAKTGYDLKNEMRDIIQSKKLKDEFNEYIDDLIKEAGGQEKIFKGFTYSGKRRYAPLTAENASKEMNAKSIRGGEGWNYGLGSVRAKVAPEFNSLDKIIKNQNRLVSKEQFDKLKVGYENIHSDILDKLSKYDTIVDSNPFSAIDNASATLGEYLGGVDKGFFFQKFKNVPSELIVEIDKFKKSLKEMPTAYFETKFKRVVQPSEFKYAIVPDNISSKTIKRMEEDGLKIVKYKNGSTEDRMNKILSLRNEIAFGKILMSPLFLGAAAGTAAVVAPVINKS
jgi:hypothetical protein